MKRNPKNCLSLSIAILCMYLITVGFASFHTHVIDSDQHDSACVLCGLLHSQQIEIVFVLFFISLSFLFFVFFQSIVFAHSKYILPFSNGPPLT